MSACGEEFLPYFRELQGHRSLKAVWVPWTSALNTDCMPEMIPRSGELSLPKGRRYERPSVKTRSDMAPRRLGRGKPAHLAALFLHRAKELTFLAETRPRPSAFGRVAISMSSIQEG